MVASAIAAGGGQVLYEPFNPNRSVQLGGKERVSYLNGAIVSKWTVDQSMGDWVSRHFPRLGRPEVNRCIKTLGSHHRSDDRAEQLWMLGRYWADKVVVMNRDPLGACFSLILARERYGIRRSGWNDADRNQNIELGSISWNDRFRSHIKQWFKAHGRCVDLYRRLLRDPEAPDPALINYRQVPDLARLQRMLNGSDIYQVGAPFTMMASSSPEAMFTWDCQLQIAQQVQAQ